MASVAHVIHVHAIVDYNAGECPECGFDSMVQIRLYQLTERGVGKLADRTRCGRCEDMKRRRP